MSTLHLFEGFGVEIEYMLVDRETLAPLPACDRVLADVAGEIVAEVSVPPLAWSNELALHVIELKTDGPAEHLPGLAATFAEHIRRVDRIAAGLGGRVMPTAMHPWMDPNTQTVLWPHEYCRVYEAFDRIFSCQGHGWSNLQSIHLNLPFADDDEFGRLHAAIRLVLPLLPALAAGSPVHDGRLAATADSRLEFYRHNAARIPLVTGRVIPEPVFTPDAYQREILQPLYAAIAPHDPAGILQHEWLNARGAIARFDRDAIEIRVLDSQECPRADLAVLELIVAVLRALVAERWSPWTAQADWSAEALETLLLDAIRVGDGTRIIDRRYLNMFGIDERGITGRTFWRHLAHACRDDVSTAAARTLDELLANGCLAARITTAFRERDDLVSIYRDLCDCLVEDRLFVG